jgi:DNA-binding winged helix-turn-helix (wHTH) protein/Tfp pilus assembly protein PilF
MILRIGDWEADLSSGELRRGSHVVVLQEKPLTLLRLLAERPGAMVRREDLRRELWPDGVYVDFDHALNTAIRKLRAAFGDSAAAPQYIETVARRGYRLIARVEGGRVETRAAGGRWRTTVLRTLAAGLLAYLWAWPQSGPPVGSAASTNPGVRRASWHSEVGDSGDELAAAALLLDTRREAALEDAARIAARLTARDPGDSRSWSILAEAHSLQALLGYREPGVALVRARELATVALRLDARDPRAHRAMADVRLLVDRDPERSERELREAIALDPSHWSSWSRLACLLHRTKRPLDALAAISRARALAPESAIVHAELGLYLHAAGRYDEELTEIRRAVQLDPRSPTALFHLGLAHARRNDYRRSIEALDRAAALSGGEVPYLAWLAVVSAQAGRTAEARRLLERLTDPARTEYVKPDLVGAIRLALNQQS